MNFLKNRFSPASNLKKAVCPFARHSNRMKVPGQKNRMGSPEEKNN